MPFEVERFLTQIKGKDYLPVAARIAWFRTENPAGSITTEIVTIDPYPIMRAVILADGVIIATAHGSAQPKPNTIYAGRELEKAETAAIGRALASAGYGTQFVGEDEFNDTNGALVDTPVEPRKAAAPAKNAAAQPAADEPAGLSKGDIMALYAYAKDELQITKKDKLLERLGIESIGDWAGTLDEAKAALEKAVDIPF